jgi:tetratricopeptide (TPR) repeat protein
MNFAFEYRQEGNSNRYLLYLDGYPTELCIFRATVMPGSIPFPGIEDLSPENIRERLSAGGSLRPVIWLAEGGDGGKTIRQYKTLEAAFLGEKTWVNRIVKAGNIQSIIKEAVNSAVAIMNRGVAVVNNGDSDSALDCFNKAILLNPSSAEAYGNRGAAYGSQGKWDLALKDLNRAIHLNPKIGKLYYDRGLVFANKQLHDLSIADYTKAINLEPRFAEAYQGRGAVYANTGRLNQAIADFTQALRLNPAYAQALCNRGHVYAELREWDLVSRHDCNSG